jgi:flavin reductase (DIM6/NTAB) family NADH-FMN oxidoreductase RutF
MAKSVLKLKDYDIHSVSTIFDGQKNANIAAWVMQTAMKGKVVAVALYQPDYTYELVCKSGILNINLLSTSQTGLINKLGRNSGRAIDKLKNVPHTLDFRGCPFLTDSVGVVHCKVLHHTPAGDHDVFICEVLKQTLLNPDQVVLKYSYLLEKKLVRA